MTSASSATGNMAELARGWGVARWLLTDSGGRRAAWLAEESDGEALASTPEVAERADLLVLCHKPAQLRGSPPKRRRTRQGGRARSSPRPRRAALRCGLRGPPVYPPSPAAVEVRRVVLGRRARAGRDGFRATPRRRAVRELGTLVVLDDALVDVATAACRARPPTSRSSPRRRSTRACAAASPPRRAPSWSCRRSPAPPSCCAGAATTRSRSAARSPPGGLTARGLDALERGGLRAAFSDALDAVLEAADDPRHRTHADRRLPLDADLRLHAADHPVHRHPAAVRRRPAPALLARRPMRSSASCATSANRSCASSAALPSDAAFDFSPILAIFTLSVINNIVVERIIHG